MKRTTLFLLAVTTASSCLFAQTTKNPFSELGYKKQITYTSSKGEFEEFHDKADVVEIGTVYFNTKTNKVLGYVNEEKETAEVATATSAMSVDPLCEKYYWISPYAFCLNNPVRFIDPDGMKVVTAGMTENELNEYNQMIALLSKSDLFKTLYSTLEKSDNVYTVSFGQTDKDKSGNSVPGNFVPDSNTDGGSITFLKDNNLNGLATTEELAHAYQNENKTIDNNLINPEFEAKTITQLVASEAGMPYGEYGGMGKFQDLLLMNYNNTLTPKDIASSKFQASYQNAAILYSIYNQTNNIGNSHYKQLTLQQPATLMRLVNNTFLKNMPWIK